MSNKNFPLESYRFTSRKSSPRSSVASWTLICILASSFPSKLLSLRSEEITTRGLPISSVYKRATDAMDTTMFPTTNNMWPYGTDHTDTHGTDHTDTPEQQVTPELMDKILNQTDPRIRPTNNGKPIVVHCNIFVISMGSIDESNMEFSLDMYLRQKWRDERLAFTDPPTPVLMSRALNKIWVPDAFFRNEKTASVHMVTTPNVLLRIYPNGTILYSLRVTLTLSCPMILTHFPMDKQLCYMHMASYAYTVEDLIFKWQTHRSVEINDNFRLSQFSLVEKTTIDCTKWLAVTGTFSCIGVNFHLKRNIGYYLLQLYVPSILIVILSWVAFWINKEAIPARVTLGVTTVLTMATQFSGALPSAPQVSYPRALDVWMAMCMFFVFAALLEYAAVNVISRGKKPGNPKKKREDADDFDPTEDHDHTNSVQVNAEKEKEPLNGGKVEKEEDEGKGNVIDMGSRYLFPSMFIVFNIIYWMVYTTTS